MDVSKEKVKGHEKLPKTRSVGKNKLKTRSKITSEDSSNNSLLSEISQAGAKDSHHLQGFNS